MDFIYMLVLTLAGLGILLFGMSLFSHALERLLGYRLNNQFMRIAKSPIKSCGFSACLTFLTQKTTLVSSMIMNYTSLGTISLRQSLPMVVGLSVGNAVSIILMIFQGFNLTTFLTLACFVGALLNLFSKSYKTQLVAKALVGFGLLFLGLELVGIYAGEIFKTPAIFDFIASVNFPIVIIIFALLLSLFTTSTFCSLTILAALVGVAGSGPIPIESAVLGMLTVPIGTSIADYIYTVSGQNIDAKRVALYHIIVNAFGFIVLAPLYFTNLYTLLFDALGQNTILTLIIVHIVQMLSTIILLPFSSVMEKFLIKIMPNNNKKKDIYAEFILPDTAYATFGAGYVSILNLIKRILQMEAEVQAQITEKINTKKQVRGIRGKLQGLDKVIKITNNTVLRVSTKANANDLQKANVLINVLSDLRYSMEKYKKLNDLSIEVADKPRALTQKQVQSICDLSDLVNNQLEMVCELIELLINGQNNLNNNLKEIFDFNKKISSQCQKLRKSVYLDYRKHGHYPEGNAYFTSIQIFDDLNSDLDNIAIKLGILAG